MVEHILFRTIERHGLTPIATEGEQPSPPFHEVASEVEGEGKDVGNIAKVLKRGYMLNGKVLRPAKVCSFVCNTDADFYRSWYIRRKVNRMQSSRVRTRSRSHKTYEHGTQE
jgi:hypothetical protein